MKVIDGTSRDVKLKDLDFGQPFKCNNNTWMRVHAESYSFYGVCLTTGYLAPFLSDTLVTPIDGEFHIKPDSAN